MFLTSVFEQEITYIKNTLKNSTSTCHDKLPIKMRHKMGKGTKSMGLSY